MDERLVAPEAHAEIIDGRVILAPGSTEARGTLHADAGRLLAAVVAEGYSGALSMLTRTDALTDIAPDVSVFAEGEDPETGGRRLEEIALEVIDAGRLSYATLKVERLAARGVRRLFCVKAATRRVCEWSHAHGDWETLDEGAVIEDRCFRVPIPVGAFVDQGLADNTVARALIAKGNPVIMAAIEEARRRRREVEERAALLARPCSRKIGRALTDEERAVLCAKLDALGVERVTEAVIDLDGDALAAWIVAPTAG